MLSVAIDIGHVVIIVIIILIMIVVGVAVAAIDDIFASAAIIIGSDIDCKGAKIEMPFT